jgi:hypothetical protein
MTECWVAIVTVILGSPPQASLLKKLVELW